MEQVDRLGWAATVPLRAGDRVIGVRTSSRGAEHLVRAAFADRIVPGTEPPPNYSLVLAPRVTGVSQDLHVLYATYQVRVRTRSVARAMEALWHELEARDQRARGVFPLIDACVVVNDGSSHLLPSFWRRGVEAAHRRWQREGFVLVDRPWFAIDIDRATISIPPPAVWIDADTVAELELEDRMEARPAPGELAIGSWTTAYGHQSPAQRVVTASTMVVDRRAHDLNPVVRTLAARLPAIPAIEGEWASDAELLQQLVTVARPSRG